MASKTPTWVWVVVGIFGAFVFVCVALIGGGIVYFRQHVHTETAPKQAVQQEFDQQRAQFAGQQPLVEIRRTDSNDSRVIVHKPPTTAERHTDLKAIRVLGYDPRENRLIRATIPVWLARWAFSNRSESGRRRVTISGDDIEFDSGDLTFEDVERNGPGLVVDLIDPRGAQVLVWAE